MDNEHWRPLGLYTWLYDEATEKVIPLSAEAKAVAYDELRAEVKRLRMRRDAAREWADDTAGELAAEVERLREELAQCRVRLAGCGVAALGHVVDIGPGDYGWSASYQDVASLRKWHDNAVAECDRLARALDEAQATCRALGKTAENFAAELAALTGHLDQLEADREYNAALVTERSAELAALKAAMPEDAALLLYRISTLAEDMADNWKERADVEEARAWAARLEAASVSQFVEAGQSDRRPQEVAA